MNLYFLWLKNKNAYLTFTLIYSKNTHNHGSIHNV